MKIHPPITTTVQFMDVDVGFGLPGNKKMTLTNVIHTTAVKHTVLLQRPSVNGPGFHAFVSEPGRCLDRIEMLRAMYCPTTDALKMALMACGPANASSPIKIPTVAQASTE